MTRHSSSKFGSALAVPSFHLFTLLAILLTLDCASISLPTFLIIQLFIHSVTCKCLSDNFLRVVSHITHRFIEMGRPFLCLLNYKRSKSLMSILRQNDNSAKHDPFIVNGIQPACGHWQVVIDNYDILGIWRIMLVKLCI